MPLAVEERQAAQAEQKRAVLCLWGECSGPYLAKANAKRSAQQGGGFTCSAGHCLLLDERLWSRFPSPSSKPVLFFRPMTKQCWLVKQEPSDYSWGDLVRDGKTPWTGVRNFQARNNLRAMRPGDQVFFYHSGDEKQIVGLAKVLTPAYRDPTATDGDWSCLDLAPIKPLPKPVTLKTIKQEPTLKDLQLVTHSRLSVMPVAEAHYEHILKLSRG